MSESNLQQLEGNTAYPSDLNISDNHHLEPPAEQVSNEVDVNCGVPNIEHHVSRMLWSEYSAI